MNKIAVIDYGMGNLHSVAKALEHVASQLGQGTEVLVTPDPHLIASADRVIFPGVGAIRDCMAEINRLDVGKIVRDAVATKPVFAVCVGMQALMSRSEENGGVDCLDLIDGEIRFFGEKLTDALGQKLKVPHMGWNALDIEHDHPLFSGVTGGKHCYFVHSYHFVVDDAAERLASTEHGGKITAVVGRDNLVGVQFHPEKSQETGLRMIGNFLTWQP